MGKKTNHEEDVDEARRVDEYVDVIGNFDPKNFNKKKKKQIKGAVLQEVKGHKQMIEGATEEAVSLHKSYSCFFGDHSTVILLTYRASNLQQIMKQQMKQRLRPEE